VNKSSRKNIALFYIALILFFKVVGLHAFTAHNDDIGVQHCEICHITTAVNFTPILEADISVVPQTEYFLSERKDSSIAANVVFNSKFLLSYHFTRPPPQFS